MFEGYPAACLDRIRGTDPGTVTEHGIFTRAPGALPPGGWGRGRVTLVGDAAHPVRPTGAVWGLTRQGYYLASQAPRSVHGAARCLMGS